MPNIIRFVQVEDSPQDGLQYARQSGSWTRVSGSNFGREVLTGNRTYWVSTSGSDSNTGLTSGTPFLTIQKAWDVLSGLDLSIYAGTIQVADGTYTGNLVIEKVPIGGSGINIYGNLATPSNVVISTASVCIQVSKSFDTLLSISGFKLTSSANNCFFLSTRATVNLGKIEWGASGASSAHIRAYEGKVGITENQTITGAGSYHIVLTLGAMLEEGSKTITLSGTLAFYQFIQTDLNSIFSSYGCTYSGGTITGQRYYASMNSTIQTYGGGANYFPGNAAGTTATGGQYS